MSNYEQDEYKFPDEDQDVDNELDIEIEVVDDTPEEDRGREPMPKEIVENLERDELEEYDAAAKEKLKQLKKVWHDERREKEAALREQQEALELSRRLLEENKRLRAAYSTGEKEYINTAQQAALYEMEAAKREMKEAYEAGDSEAIIVAQEKLNLAQLKQIRASGLRETPLQEVDYSVQNAYREPVQNVQPVVQPDRKALAWQERNKWFGDDEEMTAAALGLHQKLVNSGVEVGSDEYYGTLDKTMRVRFSEYFGEKPKTKPPTVVAPAARSTSSNKIRLSQSQVQLAKKLGITPEVYAKEVLKLEKK